MCYPIFCFHECPNVASAHRYFHANWGLPGPFHFCELQTQKLQEFWVWHFTTSDSELKTYFLNSKPKECIQLDEQPETLLPQHLKGTTFAGLQNWQHFTLFDTWIAIDLILLATTPGLVFLTFFFLSYTTIQLYYMVSLWRRCVHA